MGFAIPEVDRTGDVVAAVQALQSAYGDAIFAAPALHEFGHVVLTRVEELVRRIPVQLAEHLLEVLVHARADERPPTRRTTLRPARQFRREAMHAIRSQFGWAYLTLQLTRSVLDIRFDELADLRPQSWFLHRADFGLRRCRRLVHIGCRLRHGRHVDGYRVTLLLGLCYGENGVIHAHGSSPPSKTR